MPTRPKPRIARIFPGKPSETSELGADQFGKRGKYLNNLSVKCLARGGRDKSGIRNADDQASFSSSQTHIVGRIRGVIHCHDAKEVEAWEAVRKAVQSGWRE